MSDGQFSRREMINHILANVVRYARDGKNGLKVPTVKDGQDSSCPLPLPIMLVYPDEPLPMRQMSMREFGSRANRLYKHGISNVETEPDYSKIAGMMPFLRMVLGGRVRIGDLPNEVDDDDFNVEQRVTVNVLEENRRDVVDDYALRRDFDSVIGVSTKLPFSTCFYVYPVPDFKLSMTRANWNHLTYPMTLPGVRGRRF